jgi:hypothetical protein
MGDEEGNEKGVFRGLMGEVNGRMVMEKEGMGWNGYTRGFAMCGLAFRFYYLVLAIVY